MDSIKLKRIFKENIMAHWTVQSTSAPLAELAAIETAIPGDIVIPEKKKIGLDPWGGGYFFGPGGPGGLGGTGSGTGAGGGGGGVASGIGGMGGVGAGGFYEGGSVTAERLTGPNPSGPDEGYGALADGEYVMQKSAVQRYGLEAMQALNEGRASITMNEGGPDSDVQQLARMGRGGDTELVHMTKDEVAGLQNVAEQHGGSLTRNPETGLQEAWILEALGIAASLFSASKARKQAKELSAQSQKADTWGNTGGRELASEQLQALMKDPGQASASDPGYRMRIQGAQRAMAPYGQDSGAMAVAGAGASSDWYNQRLQQLGNLAGTSGAGIAPGLEGQVRANELAGRAQGNLGAAIQQAGNWWTKTYGATPAPDYSGAAYFS